ncbi:Ppx/GppA phosphatase family protein [Guggenheimella bovis]
MTDIEKRLAIIDLGSNSVRMDIFEVDKNGTYQLRDQAKEKVRLSEGMGDDRTIKNEPLLRLLSTLKLFQSLLQSYEVTEVHALATAAVRMATNQELVLQTIAIETGFEFKVLSGDEEGTLDYLGSVNTMAFNDALLVDIGGASTELVLIKDRAIKNLASIPFGSVNLTENFSTQKKAILRIRKEFQKLPWLKEARGLPIIGLGGTIRTIAKMQRAMDGWPLYPIHNYKLSLNDAKKLVKLITVSSDETIRNLPGVSISRSDILRNGIAPLIELINVLRPESIRISMSGLREGYFYRLYNNLYHGSDVVSDVKEASLENLEKQCRVNRDHGRYVAYLATELFDLLKGEAFTENDRKLLEVAGRLHDMGMHIDYYSHHLHGFYLMIQSGMYGLTDEEIIKVALLIGFHRGKPIHFDLLPYAKVIGLEEFERTKELALFLSIAEKLDRSESQKVTRFIREKDEIHIELKPGESSSLEEKAAYSVLSLFEKKYRVKFVFDPK